MNLQNQKLLHSFEELYQIEKKAHDLYEKQLLDNLSAHEREVIQGIHNDEERHMKIVTKIINLIKKET
jgi:rubrerythrin